MSTSNLCQKASYILCLRYPNILGKRLSKSTPKIDYAPNYVKLVTWVWYIMPIKNSGLFLKIFIILSVGQIWSHNLEFAQNVCHSFSLGEFCRKILLQLSQKIATIVAWEIFHFTTWSELVFWNLGTPIANTSIHSMYSSQTGIRPLRSELQYTRHSLRLII